MNKADFQKDVRDRILAELENEKGEAEVSRLQELSRKALELSDGNGNEIPDEDVERLLEQYPELRAEREGRGPEGAGGMTGGPGAMRR